MNVKNIEKVITSHFPSKTSDMLKFLRGLEPEQQEWVGLLMQRAYAEGRKNQINISSSVSDTIFEVN